MDQISTPPLPAIDFLDVNHTQLIPAKSTSPLNTTNDVASFLDATHAFWQSKNQLSAYQQGMFLGRGDNSNIIFDQFLKKFNKLIEEIVRTELANKNKTSEEYKDVFGAVQSLSKILTNNLKKEDVIINDQEFIPVIHGFINAYVSSIIKK